MQLTIRKLVEYITFLRIELERQKSAADKSNEVRTNELGCFMTLCSVEVVHKFLAYKSAFALSYKLNNFITAAHFARLIVDLEPTGIFASKPETLQQYSKYYQACQKKGTNAKQLKFQPQDSEQTKEVNDGYLCLG